MRYYNEVEMLSFDLVGTIVKRESFFYFWEGIIPEVVARRRGWTFRRAKKWVFAEYRTLTMDDLRWYIPSYWISRFNLPEDPKLLIRKSLSRLSMYPDAMAAIPRISKDHEVIIATGIPDELLRPILQKLGIRFDAVYSSVSDFFLPRKPPEFYLSILNDLGTDAKAILHIGDDPVQDYLNPIKAGLKALVIARGRAHLNYPHIRSLRTLEKLLS